MILIIGFVCTRGLTSRDDPLNTDTVDVDLGRVLIKSGFMTRL